MTNFSKMFPVILVSAGFLLSSGASFAAGATFTEAAPGNGMEMQSFSSQMSAFNKQDVADLVAAKTVTVIKYDDAWTSNKDRTTASDLLTGQSQTIDLLHEALKADPAAVKMLEEHKIDIKNVIDIVSDGAGAVSLYVS